MMQRDKYIAFVCTGNTCRSPMAEGIFNKLAKENGVDVRAESFGMQTVGGLSASANSVTVCSEIGVDLSASVSHSVNDVSLEKYDKFYCMSQTHLFYLINFFGISPDKTALLNVSDPYGGDTEVYRECRNQIYNSVKEIILNYKDKNKT